VFSKRSESIQISAIPDQTGKKGNQRSFNAEKTTNYQFQTNRSIY